MTGWHFSSLDASCTEVKRDAASLLASTLKCVVKMCLLSSECKRMRANQGLWQHYIRCNYKWPRAEDGEPIRSELACQPKTNCLLALTEGFYLHNSNPKAKQSALTQITGQCLLAAWGERNPELGILGGQTEHTSPKEKREVTNSKYSVKKKKLQRNYSRVYIHTQTINCFWFICKVLQVIRRFAKHTAIVGIIRIIGVKYANVISTNVLICHLIPAVWTQVFTMGPTPYYCEATILELTDFYLVLGHLFLQINNICKNAFWCRVLPLKVVSLKPDSPNLQILPGCSKIRRVRWFTCLFSER